MKIKEKLAGRRLFINSSADQTLIGLFVNGEMIAQKLIEIRSELSQRLLIEIDQLIKDNNFQIESVSVFAGPGSYTGLRIGITTANFIAWSLRVPIYEADAGGAVTNQKDYILPVYLQAAHITKPKLKL